MSQKKTSIAKKPTDLFERRLFGTDGIRGVANTYPMTSEIAMALGRALTRLLREKGASHPKIIIGKDTRLSGYMLENALVSGITSCGGTALLLGPLPTPAVAYMIRAMRAHGGVMISASHNPFQDNGLKVFGTDGFKLDDRVEHKLESWILTELKDGPKGLSGESLGRAKRIDDAEGRYLTQLKTLFGREFDLAGKKIVVDAAHGAAYHCGPALLEELGAEVVKLASAPNGLNINADCAQTDPKLLGQAVIRNRAHLGIAFDGDADRLLVADESGALISGEHLFYALATSLKEEGRLKNSGAVTTPMANQALETALAKEKITLLRSQVGDRYVTELLKKKKFVFGGETSGHFMFLDQNTTADGLFAALELLSLLQRKRMKPSKLRSSFELLPQKLIAVRVKTRKPIEQVKPLSSAIRLLEKKYSKAGRVNVRYSGTEPVLRLMLEGPNLKDLEKDLLSLKKIAEQELR